MTRPCLALLWHMHQPLYRLRQERGAALPWARLHAVRGYYDMVRVLDAFPDVRVTINLTPILVEQIAAYAGGATDLWLDAASTAPEDLDEAGRAFLVERFTLVQDAQTEGLPRLAELRARHAAAVGRHGPGQAHRDFSIEDLRDLQVLYGLAWFGFTARDDFPALRALARQGAGFTARDRAEVRAVEREILKRLLPLYRDAASSGRIALATSPYAHPILPLLADTDAAREAMPDAPLPPPMRAPHDARAQVADGLDLVERLVGVRPSGMWPSEGSISAAALQIMGECGVAWAASDDRVLAASRRGAPAHPGAAHLGPWRLASSPAAPDLLFRDHDLSDRISFRYARLEPHAAALDLFAEVARRGADGGRVVVVALDGENPWEHFAMAGGPFLRALYGAAAHAAPCRFATIPEALAADAGRGTIEQLRAGSWINADFSTWIGGPEKNRAWSVLAETRERIVPALRDPRIAAESRRASWESLRAAEGSDWFWWLDGQFATVDRALFDRLFRGHLLDACLAVGAVPPESLRTPIPAAHRLRAPAGQVALEAADAPEPDAAPPRPAAGEASL